MNTHKGCTYWYEVSMHVDKKGDGYHIPTKVRIPVRCEASGVYASRCTFLDPSSASIETKNILNVYLFDSPSAPLLEGAVSGSLRIAAQKLLDAVSKLHPQMAMDTQLDLYMAFHEVREALSNDH